MKSIALFALVFSFLVQAASPNFELWNKLSQPINYNLGTSVDDVQKKPLKGLLPNQWVSDSVDMMRGVVLLITTSNQAQTGKPVPVLVYEFLKRPGQTLYLEVVKRNGDIEVIPQIGKTERGYTLAGNVEEVPAPYAMTYQIEVEEKVVPPPLPPRDIKITPVEGDVKRFIGQQYAAKLEQNPALMQDAQIQRLLAQIKGASFQQQISLVSQLRERIDSMLPEQEQEEVVEKIELTSELRNKLSPSLVTSLTTNPHLLDDEEIQAQLKKIQSARSASEIAPMVAALTGLVRLKLGTEIVVEKPRAAMITVEESESLIQDKNTFERLKANQARINDPEVQSILQELKEIKQDEDRGVMSKGWATSKRSMSLIRLRGLLRS
jgi:hypothetical protein